MNWHTTFGEIEIIEQAFLLDGKFIRPFSNAAKVRCKSYSRPLQRRVTDFGADVGFGKIPQKLKEHYGITIPESSCRNITESHARLMRKQERINTKIPDQIGVDCIVAGMDGSMIPIVDVDNTKQDKRKTRLVRWKEARLTLAHAKGSLNSVFGATLGDTEDAGDYLAHCCIRAGIGKNTAVHCVGDGAAWIFEQVDRVFGTQAEFLIDFYHLCDYLSAASKTCDPDNSRKWFEKQKDMMKDNQVKAVLQKLMPHIEPETVPDRDAPVRCCYRYIRNRPFQFDYKKALEQGLPIGSGEIESAHRYVIQDRLKIAGAWWKEDNAQDMLSLRTLRENGNWENYWSEYVKKAA